MAEQPVITRVIQPVRLPIPEPRDEVEEEMMGRGREPYVTLVGPVVEEKLAPNYDDYERELELARHARRGRGK